MKLINKELLITAKIVDKKHLKEVLRGVHITPTHIVATDSHKLIAISREDALDSNDFPYIEQTPYLNDNGVTVRADKILKEIKFPKSNVLPIFEEMLLVEKDKTVAFVSTDLETTKTIELSKMEDDYINWERVVPVKDEKTFELTLNPKIMIELLTAFKEYNKVSLFINEEKGKPVLLEEGNKIGVIMPVTL